MAKTAAMDDVGIQQYITVSFSLVVLALEVTIIVSPSLWNNKKN